MKRKLFVTRYRVHSKFKYHLTHTLLLYPTLIQVKTTHPHRYVVRPNHGIVAPNSSETISIWSYYDHTKQSPSEVDNSKDKFLIQSCAVGDDFARQFEENKKLENGQYCKQLIEAVTTMWNDVENGRAKNVTIYRKKYHVRHQPRHRAICQGIPLKPSHDKSTAPLPKPSARLSWIMNRANRQRKMGFQMLCCVRYCCCCYSSTTVD